MIDGGGACIIAIGPFGPIIIITGCCPIIAGGPFIPGCDGTNMPGWPFIITTPGGPGPAAIIAPGGGPTII